MNYRILNSTLQNKTITTICITVIAIIYASVGLLQSKYCLGWDSYFYLTQVKSWFENGELHSSRFNLFYPLLISIRYFITDYVLAYKIMSILIFTAFTMGVYSLLNSITDKRSALIITLISLSNPFLIFFASQYTKNLLGITLLLFALHLLLKKRIYLSLFIFLSLLILHKLAFVIGIMCLALYTTRTVVQKFPTWTLCAAISFTTSVLIFIVYKKEASTNLHFAPYSFFKSHNEIMNPYWILILIIYTVLFLVTLFKTKQNRLVLLLLPVLSFLILPILKWNQLGIALRMFLVFSILVPILLTAYDKHLRYWMLVPVLFSILFSVKAYNPKKQDPPYTLYSYISKKLTFNTKFKEANLIIAHKSLAEFISFNTDKDVLPWAINKDSIDDTVLRIVYIPYSLKMKFNRLLDTSFMYQITSEYALIQEKEWKAKFIDYLSSEELALVNNWKNPMQVRPFYLKK